VATAEQAFLVCRLPGRQAWAPFAPPWASLGDRAAQIILALWSVISPVESGTCVRDAGDLGREMSDHGSEICLIAANEQLNGPGIGPNAPAE
jgi:hypothetical protein